MVLGRKNMPRYSELKAVAEFGQGVGGSWVKLATCHRQRQLVPNAAKLPRKLAKTFLI